jgi:hypothetical protein
MSVHTTSETDNNGLTGPTRGKAAVSILRHVLEEAFTSGERRWMLTRAPAGRIGGQMAYTKGVVN